MNYHYIKSKKGINSWEIQKHLKCVFIPEKREVGEKKKRKLVGTVLCAIPKYILKTTLNFYSQIIFSANRELGRDE